MKCLMILALAVLATNAMENHRQLSAVFEGSEQACSDTCDDVSVWCGHDRMKAFCNHTNYVGIIVREKCALSCGTCRLCPNVEPRSCGEEVDTCQDTNKFCATYLAPAYCNNHLLSFLVQRVCKRSCGKCPVNNCARSSVSNQIPCTEDCADMDAECQYWAEVMNYCSPASLYKTWMETRCRKSCKKCVKCGESELIAPPEAVEGLLVAPARPSTESTTELPTTSEMPDTTTEPPTTVEAETAAIEVFTEVPRGAVGCDVQCRNGSCSGQAENSICVCDKSAPGVLSPRCGGQCEANCARPDDFIGQWEVFCTGEIVCTCHPTGDVEAGIPGGALCR
nr:uncharacterized protein LOC100184100 isoform X1 [Ciona intestinalis]|eukprot:XP_018673157.1 uncharacterized protein LOC100184100 isoform X1 [Ciona intestinalis]